MARISKKKTIIGAALTAALVAVGIASAVPAAVKAPAAAPSADPAPTVTASVLAPTPAPTTPTPIVTDPATPVSVFDAVYGSDKATVTRTVDGDTIVVKITGGVEKKIRLIGVDTPETHKPRTPVQPYGPEAEKYTRDRLTGRAVTLIYDKGQTDFYGRSLAYVYLGDGEEFFNATLVIEGYARADKVYPNIAHSKEFAALEAEAKAAHKGRWK